MSQDEEEVVGLSSLLHGIRSVDKLKQRVSLVDLDLNSWIKHRGSAEHGQRDQITQTLICWALFSWEQIDGVLKADIYIGKRSEEWDCCEF